MASATTNMAAEGQFSLATHATDMYQNLVDEMDTSPDDELGGFGANPSATLIQAERGRPLSASFTFPSFEQDVSPRSDDRSSSRTEGRLSTLPDGDPSAKENRSPQDKEEQDQEQDGWQYRGDERPKHRRMNTFSSEGSGGSSPSDIFGLSPSSLAGSFSHGYPEYSRPISRERQRSSSSSWYPTSPPSASAYRSPSSSIGSHLSRSATRDIPSVIDIFASPIYSEATHHRARQHSLDQSLSRPAFTRRGSSSSSRSSHAFPYSSSRRSSTSSSSRGSSAPSSRRGSLAGLWPLSPHQGAEVPLQPPLDPSTPPPVSPTRSRRGSIVALPPQPIDIPPPLPFPFGSPAGSASSSISSRRPSVPWAANSPFARSRASSSASQSPVEGRFAFPSPLAQAKGPSCSMFDPPLLRKFGTRASALDDDEEDGERRRREDEDEDEETDGVRAEDALAEAVMGLGLGLGLALGEESREEQRQPELELMDEGEKVLPPAMSSDLLSETVAFLDSRNKLARGQKSVLILSPTRVQVSVDRMIRPSPPPLALLLGEWWSEVARSQPSASEMISPPAGSVPPVVRFSFCGVQATAAAQWMQDDGGVVGDGGPEARVIAGRFVGDVAVPSTLVDAASPLAALVTADHHEGMMGSFLGPSMQLGASTEDHEFIHHGSLVAVKRIAKAGQPLDGYLSMSSTASVFPMTDWRAATCGGRRPYRIAGSDFVVSTSTWDAFIVYAVDPLLESKPSTIKQSAFAPGYPSPPLNAIPFDPRFPSRIHYNQPIILQSMATGQLSPMVAVRAFGGLRTSGPFSSLLDSALLPHLDLEMLGAPITADAQLAFEMVAGAKGTQSFFDPSRPASDGPVALGATATWSFEPVDIARHSFYIPRSITAPSLLPLHLPSVVEYDPPTASAPYITLYGSNFSATLTIWISLHRAPYYILKSSSVILVPPPPFATPLSVVAAGAKGRRIAIGLGSGVVIMTNVLYRE